MNKAEFTRRYVMERTINLNVDLITDPAISRKAKGWAREAAKLYDLSADALIRADAPPPRNTPKK